MADITHKSYWAEIKNMADNIYQEVTEDVTDLTDDDIREQVMERAWEDVDGHQWIIYYSYNQGVIRFSDNEGAHEDFGGDALVGKSYADMGTIVACCAMRADLEQALCEVLENANIS